MSKHVKCPDCKERPGYANNNRTKPCSTCNGSGRLKKRQRGHHDGWNFERRGYGNGDYCVCGRLKTGTTVDGNGEIRLYCMFCHNEVCRAKKEKNLQHAR